MVTEAGTYNCPHYNTRKMWSAILSWPVPYTLPHMVERAKQRWLTKNLDDTTEAMVFTSWDPAGYDDYSSPQPDWDYHLLHWVPWGFFHMTGWPRDPQPRIYLKDNLIEHISRSHACMVTSTPTMMFASPIETLGLLMGQVTDIAPTDSDAITKSTLRCIIVMSRRSS